MRRQISRNPDLSLLLLRLFLAGVFLWNGVGKLFPWRRTVSFFDSVGMPSPPVTATLNMTAEAASGFMMLLGVGTAAAGILIVLDQLLVILPVNLALGDVPWVYVASVNSPALAIVLAGPGRYRLGARKSPLPARGP